MEIYMEPVHGVTESTMVFLSKIYGAYTWSFHQIYTLWVRKLQTELQETYQLFLISACFDSDMYFN